MERLCLVYEAVEGLSAGSEQQVILPLQWGSSLWPALVSRLCVPVGLDRQLFPAFRLFSPRISPKLCPLQRPQADYASDTTHSFSSPRQKNEVTLKYMD